MPKRTRSDSKTPTRQILKAAREILTTGGLESVIITALADLLDMSEAALYRHVDSKNEILLETYSRYGSQRAKVA
ncbi:MAG: helix-turn-helix domain-containing protein [Dehalococcoidia bacterium]|nr:helix-turn-helix domain-containing protein [Dehalococcoidia bacterium]